MGQENFGLNTNPLSFRILRSGKDATTVPTPEDPKLAALAQSLKLAGPQTPVTPPALQLPGAPTDLVKPGVVGVNALLGKVKSLGSQIRQPLNKITAASQQTQRAVRDVQGIVQQGAMIKQDFNTAVKEAKKLGEMLGILQPEKKKKAKTIADELNDLLKAKKGANANTKSDLSSRTFDRVRISWMITTQEDVLLGNPPINFFVNPSKVSFASDYLESLEFVQKGNFYTRWRSDSDGRAFPNLKVGFTFQSSNILPETYSDVEVTVTDLKVTVPGQSAQMVAPTYNLGETTYSTPPGIDNFYNILGILNATTTIDGSKLTNLSAEERLAWDGQPNFVILRLSTRTFPLMTVEGFIMQGWSLEENAEDPLKFEIPLQMVAFKSDPPWWDRSKVLDRYDAVYQDWIGGNQSSELVQAMVGALAANSALKDIQNSSKIEPETLEAAASVKTTDASSPSTNAPARGESIRDTPTPDVKFGNQTQQEVAYGNVGLNELRNPKSSNFDSGAAATHCVAPVGDKAQTTVKLSNGDSYVEYQSPNGTKSVSCTDDTGKTLWTSYTSAAAADGTKEHRIADNNGAIQFLGKWK
jgi:hypothetical protein